ncbi:MAG: LTA synthase family protein [Myxococcales bacterium]|jgi:glucan phosphoethanolaminetransferase (alkaline phosphatase superfamily)|nr:LTA synthase family protein [Myxococcales bacterium]
MTAASHSDLDDASAASSDASAAVDDASASAAPSPDSTPLPSRDRDSDRPPSKPLPGGRFEALFEGLSLPKLAALLLIGLALRLALFPRAFIGLPSFGALLWGLFADLGFALCLAPPPLATQRPWAVWIQRVATALFFAAFTFWSCFEFFYFDEFATRADQVVLDYVFYTGEVTGNVFETYPVVLIVTLCAVFGALLAALFAWLGSGTTGTKGARPSRRLAWFTMGVLFFVASAALDPPFDDRPTREIAQNGLTSLTRAAFTGELDYASHYSTIPNSLPTLRDFLSKEPGFVGFTGEGGIRRRIATERPEQRLNLVLVLAESLGRELTGLGRAPTNEPSFTPHLDALVAESLLFDRFYATGTRTARALEGALASFPPVPGNAIVRLRRQRPLDSIARVLTPRGYEARFVYGGDLGFDNMAAFLEVTGFSGADEDAGRDLPNAFSTAWGAADEFVFDRALTDLRAARSSGRPLFLTILTVSNHRPFLFPEGRVEGAVQRTREGATRYADFALGRFFDALRAEGFQRDTIVAVVGDHGPRSYTRERMPADAHRVPFLVWGPEGVVTPGVRRDVVGSTLDVTPTLLGLLGGTYTSSFFGRDLARVTDGGLAPLQDKQDVGVRLPNGLVILGFNEGNRFEALDANDAILEGDLGEEAPRARDLAISLFQTAYELYVSDRLATQNAEAIPRDRPSVAK